MADTITIEFNGRGTDVAGDCTVESLVCALTGSSEAAGIAVAVNREVVPRSDWKGFRVSEGDRVEVLTPAQGG
ncbi:MAG: sulfur carrier protein ThiS [Actinomycetota bacterium]|nr:sulfur carrier protein ThiS [Actinomycetota bacterium]